MSCDIVYGHWSRWDMLWKVWFTIDNVLCSVVVLFVTMWCLPLRRRCLPLGRRGCRTLSVDCVHTSSKQTYPSSHTSPTSIYSSFTSRLTDEVQVWSCFQFTLFYLTSSLASQAVFMHSFPVLKTICVYLIFLQDWLKARAQKTLGKISQADRRGRATAPNLTETIRSHF